MRSKMLLQKLMTFVTVSLFLGQTVNAFELPEYEYYQLQNGLSVYLMPQKEVPLIDVLFVTRAGSALDGENYGLANVTAKTMLFGTQAMTKATLDERMDFIGADLKGSASKDSTQIQISAMKQNTMEVLSLLKTQIREPRFAKPDFQHFVEKTKEKLKQARQYPGRVLHGYFEQSLFGEHPYGKPLNGTLKSLEQLDLEKVKAFHQQWYQPNRSAVIVSGDFDIAQVKKLIHQYFSSWEAQKQKLMVRNHFQSTQDKQKVLLVNKEDAHETQILVGGPGIAFDHPDATGIAVINTILGGRFTSWLNDELRVNSGLTYGARSRWSKYDLGGSFAMTTFTKTATTFEALDLMLKTYNRLFKEGIDQKTLDSAKAYIQGQFPPKYETSTQLAALIGNMFVYGFDKSYINGFEKRVQSLNKKEVDRLIQTYFPNQGLQIVLIGKADDLREKTKQYGELTEVSILQELL
ncbi:M16 family metallopeptidase [Algicola sagamiensis]|uniref:M16 family metallopeptidase n=1 Tax=Algicola sagamiensis TaxID=163869 RepID=UPI0003782465|nr:pitrilysin family protein [Algicola sagamiensis]